MSAKTDLKLPALDPADLPAQRGTTYPEPFRARVAPRSKKKLGDALGLTQFGVNLVTLEPGGQSALRHWHTREDEFIYLLAGEVVLVTDAGEQILRAGQCAGYAAGARDAHHFINRSREPAQYLEIGSRFDDDIAHYPDDDLMWAVRDGRQVPARKDGRPY